MNISTERCSIHYTQPKQIWCNEFVTNIKRNLTLFFLNLLVVSSSAYGQLPGNANTGKLTTFNLTNILYYDQQAGAEHTGINNVGHNEWNTIQSGTLASNANVQFTLDAMNPIRSLVVNTKFAPPAAADIDQLRNGGIGEPPTPNNWVNGNAGPENSHFIESWSIPYRMRITGLTNNSSHNIIIEWDIMGSSGTKHAIDYITHFQNLGSNTLHSALFGHNAEVVNPGFGLTVSSTNTFTIPTPSSAGSPVLNQPTNSFNALNLKDFTIYNGTITSMSYVSQGDLNTDGSKTRLSINFTANFSGGANTVILGWGGHIASQADWGIGESASDINGSPYHTRLIELDGSGGNQDRSLKADAVVIPPECNITSPDLCPLTTSSTASASLTNSAGVATSYSWSLIGTNTAGATLTGSTSGSVAAGVIVIPSVGISAPAGGFASGTSFTVQLSVSRTFSGVVFTSTCTKTVNITNSVVATATANPTSIDIRTAAHNTTLNVSVSSGSINDYDLLWTEDGAGSLNFNNVVSPVYTAVPTDQGQTITFNVTLTPKAGTTGLCPNNASVIVPVNATSTCVVTCLTNCSPCDGSVSTFRGPTLDDPLNTFYAWAITSGDAVINGPTNGENVSVTAGLTNYRLELTITYSNSALNQAPCGINVTVGDVQASDGHTDVSCFGGSDGSVTITFSGGTAPYEINFNGGGFAAQTSPKTYSGLAAGSYSWTVRDANGCVESGSETVGQPTAVQASDAHTDVSCFGGSDGSVTITFSGGTAPYEINFNGGGFAAQTSPKTYSGLAAGSYSWVVRDAHGCEASGSETVGQPTAVQASDGHTDVSCFGGSDGSVTITFSGGTAPYEINFNGGGFAAQTSPKTYSGLAAGSYSWVVRDAHGCEASGSETVGQPTAVQASDAHTDVSCFGGSDGSVTITFSGGTAPYEINFNGGGFAAQTSPKTYSGLAAGSYSWVVRDAHGCEASGSETVGQPTAVQASDGHTDVSCFGGSDGSVTITFSGGTAPYEINFNGGGFAAQTSPKTYSGLAAGSYSWVVRDAHGCEASGSETVGQPTAVTCNLTTPSIPSCGTTGNTVSGTVSGGTGPYTCSAVFDGTGTGAGWAVTNCAVVGGAITVTYTTGSVANTVLTVTVTDANNCTSTCTVTLTCEGGKGCTPGFWKTHPEMWDNCSDPVVQAIPGASCTGTGTSGNFTPGADFTTSTPFVAYFGITNNTCGGGCRIANLPSTMGAAMSAGGGDCKKLARTGVAALLNAAVFGSDYLDATGFASYEALYNAIMNGFNTCTYEPLATNLDNANNQDHSLCSGLPGTILTSSIVSSNRINSNDVTLNVGKLLTVQAYPNPFNSEINFRFISPESGYANLEVFDMVGRKLSIVYAGHVDANVQRTVTYRVPVSQQVPMVYKLTVNGKTVVGKLLPGDRNNNY